MAEYNGEENLHMSDVMEVIQNDEIGGTILDDDMHTEMEDEFQGNSFSPIMEHHHLQNESHRPYIEILEQPASGIRFRYEIEGRSAGSIPGENSRPDMKTYPTIRVVGYTGSITIVVSCVTVEDNPNNRPRAHPHKLVGRAESCKNGVCRVRLRGDNMTVSFPNLGIQCVRRKDVEASLTEREKERVDPFAVGFEHRRTHANIALNVVRLCFQGFIPRKINGKKDWEPLAPVVSNPIVEKKATCTLSIHKLSHYCASVAGGMEMILLCDKVPRDDIQIRFYEERDGRDWEGYGEFQPAHVHHQYAISFRTPKYDNMDITEPVKVKIQLKLKKKDQGGPPLDFEMLPLANNEGILKAKRKSPRDFVAQNSDKRPKFLDPSLHQDLIKKEPTNSPFPTFRETVSPIPCHSGAAASTQAPLNYLPYNVKASPANSPQMQFTEFNIPYTPYNYPQTTTTTNNVSEMFIPDFEPPIQQVINPIENTAGGISLTTPNESDGTRFFDLDRQQYLESPIHLGTSELLALVDERFSADFSNGLNISATEPQPEQLNENLDDTESLSRLARDIQDLNEMVKPSRLE
ncbi:embryonic polarity protein dorsal-like isoform X2 [Leptopilina boulardi]|uniref:embryonic polarity protein dorsal-like isoform X2 n=1 Tax=Leptopilina boulardi TaxID=63433 RepID=UPI0021F62DE4|nr:embryonic polarity protein dorsal-like isoform X2 [Leptopilina boulardi]